jgi:hypothetical protein
VINGNEVVPNCPHVCCTHQLHTGKCLDECIKRYRAEMGTSNHAFWRHRSAYNDFIWCECSNCGFRVEAYKAVVSEDRDTNYVDVKYKYCPICGKEMRV